MTGLYRVALAALGLALLAAAWPLYRAPAMGMMLSAVTFCQ